MYNTINVATVDGSIGIMIRGKDIKKKLGA